MLSWHQLDTASDVRLSELGAALVANLHRLFEGVTARSPDPYSVQICIGSVEGTAAHSPCCKALR